MALATAGLFISEMKHGKPAKPPEEKPAPAMPAVFPPVEPQADQTTAKKAIAVAGEYWKITKKEYRDYTVGGATLKAAKQEYAKGNYGRAWRQARLSIDQFKLAKKFGVKYRVKRNECLWNIAKMKKHYGRGSAWVKIWRANEKIIKDFNLIFPRQVLFVPWVKRHGVKT